MDKRIIYYYQTFTTLKPICHKGTKVTHIHLSSIHFGLNDDNTSYIHLNDYVPYDKRFDSVWKEIEEAKTYNIKIILMIGGAGGGYYQFFKDYDTCYLMLIKLIKDTNIDGVDLDIEEEVDILNVIKLINDIRNDFGDDFIIAMAPVQSSMENDIEGMGGFVYKDLYKKVGSSIDYFNVQFYTMYNYQSYKQCITNGYPSNKIVMGMLSGNYNSSMLSEIKKCYNDYQDFGGCYIWEYFDSPKDWSELIYNQYTLSYMNYFYNALTSINWGLL